MAQNGVIPNGHNGHGDDGTFLFTSESVAEGHPGIVTTFLLVYCIQCNKKGCLSKPGYLCLTVP